MNNPKNFIKAAQDGEIYGSGMTSAHYDVLEYITKKCDIRSWCNTSARYNFEGDISLNENNDITVFSWSRNETYHFCLADPQCLPDVIKLVKELLNYKTVLRSMVINA
jgi:hypothetical protein